MADPVDDARLADLADLVLSVARGVLRGSRGPAGAPASQGDDLTRTEVTLLRSIDRDPGVSPSALALRTGIQRSNVSAALRTLEARGLIERVDDDSDGRAARLRSTALASADLAAVRERWAALLRAALGEEADGLDAAIALLGRLDDALVGIRTAPTPH